MTLTLPDDPAFEGMEENDIRLDLACALFAAGRISRSVAASVARMDGHTFDEELARRRISTWTEETLDEDLTALARLFPA